MESNSILQKKTLTIPVAFIIALIVAAESAEIINFIYLAPFSLAFLLMINAAEIETYPVKSNFIIPFMCGIISDIVFFKRIFLFSLLFVIFSYITSYLTDYLKLNKRKIFATTCFLYSLSLYIFFSTPLWVCILVFLISFLQWIIVSFLTSKMLSGKHSGET